MMKNSEDTLLIFQSNLRNLPRDFVVHCMSLAESLDLKGALQKGLGQFTIMDFANDLTKEKYHIRFGDTE